MKRSQSPLEQPRCIVLSSQCFSLPLCSQDLYFRYTLDSFAEIAFGQTTGCLSDGAEVPFAKAFDLVQAHTSARFFGPLWPLKRALGLGSERVIADNMRVIANFGYDVIDRTRRQRQVDKAEKPDLLSRFIDYAESNQTTIENHELLDVVVRHNSHSRFHCSRTAFRTCDAKYYC